MSSGGKGGGGQTVGYKYYMAVHMGVARGPLDEIIDIRVGDKQAWKGSVTGNTTFQIDAPELFGGDAAEGGIQGPCTVYMGGGNQAVDPAHKALVGGNVPDWRGVTTLFFDGLISALNPYPKTWKMRVRRTLAGWDGPVWQPGYAQIKLAGGAIVAANGAHILYECITNRKWGRGLARSWIDELAFSQAAETLFKEGLGLCLRWTRQTELGEFVQTVLNHIGGALYIDRQTGLVTLRLVRQDYDSDSLPLFDKNSGLLEISEDETASPGSVVNEQIVTFVDPILDDTRQVRAQNLASIQTLGYKNSATTVYEGIPTVELAGRLALRDLRAQSTTLRRYKCVLDRRAWKITPGGVFRISAPERGIANLVLRAGDIKDTTLKDGKITVSAVIDVFGMPSSSYVVNVESGWSPPDATPVTATVRRVEEATYRSLYKAGYTAEQIAAFDDTSGAIQTMARKPSALSGTYTVASKAAGEEYAQPGGTQDWTSSGYLSSALTRFGTTFTVTSPESVDEVAVGQAVQIDDEVMKITAWDFATLTATTARGCVDTKPEPHASGAPVFFIDTSLNTDGREYVTSEVVSVKLLTKTTNGSLALDDAPVNTFTIYGRQGRPYLPGQMKVDGNRFDAGSAKNGNFVFTWAARNRLLSQDVLVSHDDAAQVMETNGQHRIEIRDGSTLKRQVDVPGATSTWTYTTAMQNADFTVAPGGSKALTARVYAFTYDSVSGIFLQSWWNYDIPITIQR